MVTIYTTETCSKCKVLKTKLEQKGIEYKEVNDIHELESKNFMTVPMLEVDNKVMDFKEAVTWINGR